jgi:hypothetical protein
MSLSIIVDYTETVMDGNKGPADGNYATREEAEASALREEQRAIMAESKIERTVAYSWTTRCGRVVLSSVLP